MGRIVEDWTNKLGIDIGNTEFSYMLKMIGASIMVFISNLLGGFDDLLMSLGILICCDYALGVIYAASIGGIKSGKMAGGIFKKGVYFIIIVVANAVENAFPQFGGMLRHGTVILLIMTEGSSIVENLTLLNFPVPERLKQIFDVGTKNAEDNLANTIEDVIDGNKKN